MRLAEGEARLVRGRVRLRVGLWARLEARIRVRVRVREASARLAVGAVGLRLGTRWAKVRG